MRRLGVSDGRGVVVYDDVDGSVAARAWWLLRWLGHGDVRLLDGGLTAWTAAGLPLEQDDTNPEPGDFTARPGAMPVLDADAAASLASDGVLLDARAAERFRGEVEPVDPVAGHVPGARSAPTTGNVGADGRFLDPAALRDRFAAVGASRRCAGRRLLRVGRHRRAHGARPGGRRHPGRAVRRVVVGVGHRPLATGGYRTRVTLSRACAGRT